VRSAESDADPFVAQGWRLFDFGDPVGVVAWHADPPTLATISRRATPILEQAAFAEESLRTALDTR
jgi:hypothetical protein